MMTRQAAPILSLIVSTAFASGVQAQTTNHNEGGLWGVGHTTCTAALAFDQARDAAALDTLVNWTQGYLSAKIEEQIASGAELFRLASPSIVEANLISFCSDNRGKLVSDAAAAFSRKLVVK